MLRLLIEDTALDLPSNFSLRIQRDNTAYLGADVEAIKGGFSYPFDLPLTPRNRRILKNPGRIDSASSLAGDLRATLYFGPDLLLAGKLNVLRSDTLEAKCAFINNPLDGLKDRKLNEVDIGQFDFSSTTELREQMRQSTLEPLGQPFIAFPVFNGALGENTDIVPDRAQFQNDMNYDTGVFEENTNLSIFLRAEWLLREMMQEIGYQWTDLFHVSDEHKQICLINNRAMKLRDGAAGLVAPYNSLLPGETAASFLKSYCRLFGLAPFSSLAGNDVTLQPLNPLVHAATRKDWTKYARAFPARQPSNRPRSYGYSNLEAPPAKWFGTWEEFDEQVKVLPSFTQDYVRKQLYYVLSANRYFRQFTENPLTEIPYLVGGFGRIVHGGEGEDVLSSLAAAAQGQLFFYPEASDNLILPAWSSPLKPPVTSSEGSNESIRHVLAIYRGLQLSSSNRSYPFGGMNNYTVTRTRIPNTKLNLRWHGEDGLYANHWQEWDAMLRSSDMVKRSFVLPMAELFGFDFRNKVRVENRNYFIRKIDFLLSNAGVTPAECELISVS